MIGVVAMERRSIRDAFADALIALVEETGRSAVSVVDLTSRVSCARKTFYRNFDDIDDLIVWYFRRSLRDIVLNQFPDAVHVKPHSELLDKYADWPFYARIIDESGNLQQGSWASAAASHFEQHPKYYSIIFREGFEHRLDLLRYIRNLLTPAIRDDILFMLNGRMLPHTYIDFLAEYHAAGITGRLDWFVRERNSAMSGESSLHWNYAHDSIDRDLREYFSRASSSRARLP